MFDLHRGHAAGPDALRVVAGLLVSFHHGDRELAPERPDGLDEQGGLARARARHQVEREDSVLREAAPVGGGIGIVSGEDVSLDLDEAFLAEARHGKSRLSGAVVVVPVQVQVAVTVARGGVVRLRGRMMGMGVLDMSMVTGRDIVATAHRAHGASLGASPATLYS